MLQTEKLLKLPDLNARLFGEGLPMNEAEIKKNWLLQNEKICLCKAIPRKRFLAAIRSGAGSVEEINKIVGSGDGDCRGERCGPKIEQLLRDFHANSNS